MNKQKQTKRFPTKSFVKSKPKNEHDPKFFNIKKVKHEVMQLGVSGLDSQQKRDAKIQMAIRLGAIPPKNKCKNYKLLLEEKKKENARLKSQQQFQQLGKNQIGKSTAKSKGYDRKLKKEKNKLLDAYGTVEDGKSTKKKFNKRR